VAEQPGSSEHEHISSLVKAFIQMMQTGNIARLELEHGDLKVSLRAHEAVGFIGASVPAQYSRTPQELLGAAELDATQHTITAPMIGTFYDTPAPGEPPFVAVGDHVEEGQTVGIIEAMKIMNEIAADRSGTVAALLATSGATVEYGSPLVQLDLGSSG
jgi:acetyl-CoA carboxylase biotin carboxyl carrier protein